MQLELDLELVGLVPQKQLPLEIYTDGSCPNNPGGAGGYGVVLLTEPKPVELSGHIASPTTNNRAELMAVIVGVMHAQLLGYKNLIVYSDSQYVVKTLNNLYSKRKNKDLWDLADLVIKTTTSCKFEWVKGHAGNVYNEVADKLASNGTYMY